MTMQKRQKQLLAILAIVAMVFTVAVFLIPFPKGGIFWIAYAAEIIALGLQIPFFKAAFDNAEELKSKVLGFPVFRVGYLYLGIQTAVSLALFALGFVPGFPVWLAALACLLVLAGGLICGISADIAHEEIAKAETVQKPDTALMQSLRTRSAVLVNRTEDAQLRKALESLAENFRFSDPVSSPMIAAQEAALEEAFDSLEKCISDPEAAKKQCNIVAQRLAERNTACSQNKHQA